MATGTQAPVQTMSIDPQQTNNTTQTDVKRQLLLQARQAQHWLGISDYSQL
jgi:hypothetical protein